MTAYVNRVDEGVPVFRISRGRLNAVLDIDNDEIRKKTIDALIEADLVRPHRKATGPDFDGYTLPPGWGAEHVPVLRQRARALLRDQGVEIGSSAARFSVHLL